MIKIIHNKLSGFIRKVISFFSPKIGGDGFCCSASVIIPNEEILKKLYEEAEQCNLNIIEGFIRKLFQDYKWDNTSISH